MRTVLLFSVLALSHMPALAAPQDSTLPPEGASPARTEVEILHQFALPAGTEIRLEMLQTVTTDGGEWKEGDEFQLTVTDDVSVGAYMIIPTGTLAFGHVRRRSPRGVFGKAGKIEIEIDRLVLGGRDIPVTGVYRQAGEGGLTNAATVLAAGPLAAFITGQSGTIEKGAIVSAYLVNDLPVVSPYRATMAQTSGQGGLAIRARQISVAEAFGTMPREEAPKPKPKAAPKRVTVAEAFKAELAGLDD